MADKLHIMMLQIAVISKKNGYLSSKSAEVIVAIS